MLRNELPSISRQESYRPELPEILMQIDPKIWREQYAPFEPCIQLYTTMACNLGCDNCFVTQYLTIDPSSKLPLETSKLVIDNNPLVTRYDYMGGEPGLDPKIQELVEYLVAKNKQVDIFTNAFNASKFMNLPTKCVRFRITNYAIDGKDPSRKPLLKLEKNIHKIAEKFPVVLSYLMDRENADDLKEYLRIVKDRFPYVDLVKIGCARNEKDYANDNLPGVLSFERYAEIVRSLLDDPKYYGPSNLNIFTEGVLYTDNMPKYEPHQLGRFKSILFSGFARGLYAIDPGFIVPFDPRQPLDYGDPLGFYSVNGREWTDQIKIRLML